MLRSYTSICQRLYHDSSFNRKAPVIKFANSKVRTAVKKRLDDQTNVRVQNNAPSKTFKPFPYAVTEENKLEILQRTVTPLYDLPYEQQLETKQSNCKSALRYLTQQLYKGGTPVRINVAKLPCNVKQIIGSPDLYKFKGRDLFSVWRGIDGETKTVGYHAFPISKHGDTVCIEPNGSKLLRDCTVKMADILQEFMRNEAKLPVCYSLGTEGGWRQFSITTNQQNHMMLVGYLSPTALKVQAIVDERENFKGFILKRSKEAGIDLKSLYFQPCPHTKCPNKVVPFELLHGHETIEEVVNGFRFQLTPESLIETNTRGLEMLYNTVKDVTKECFTFQEKPIVIDPQCGIGMSAIQLASIASRAVGFDSDEQAIDEANNNARLNGLEEHLDFYCAQFEIVLERLLEKHKRHYKNFMVVCNPRKSGFKRIITQTIRECENIDKIIYISPKPTGEPAIDDLTTLCQKGSSQSLPPFVPVLAVPVDTQPHTDSCNLVIALERLDK